MKMRTLTPLALALCASALLAWQATAQRTPSGMIREEQQITINGVPEVWRLEWKEPPKPYCPADYDGWRLCPCAGFAFGETAAMDLIRITNGYEIERLSVGNFFPDDYGHKAVLPLWPATQSDFDSYLAKSDSKEWVTQWVQTIRKRPAVKIMNFADYDHDGEATEFFIQTEVIACGHRNGIVAGVSKLNPHLHAFGTALHPNQPLHLAPWQWDALRKSATPARMKDISCGDHGSDDELELELAATPTGIRVIRREYNCTDDDKRGRLIKTSIQ